MLKFIDRRISQCSSPMVVGRVDLKNCAHQLHWMEWRKVAIRVSELGLGGMEEEASPLPTRRKARPGRKKKHRGCRGSAGMVRRAIWRLKKRLTARRTPYRPARCLWGKGICLQTAYTDFWCIQKKGSITSSHWPTFRFGGLEAVNINVTNVTESRQVPYPRA